MLESQREYARAKSDIQTEGYPFADSDAAKMLQRGFRRAAEERELSQRTIAKRLEYKQSVALSHMALGRIPIPIERAEALATILELDKSGFMRAVLQQRYPDVDVVGLITEAPAFEWDIESDDDLLVADLRAIAGRALSSLLPGQLRVIKEAAVDPNASKRWLSVAELPVIEEIRKLRPEFIETGMDAASRMILRQALSD